MYARVTGSFKSVVIYKWHDSPEETQECIYFLNNIIDGKPFNDGAPAPIWTTPVTS